MNSRLAVSLLFIAVGVMIVAQDAKAAFKKLERLQDSLHSRGSSSCVAQTLHEIESRVSARVNEILDRNENLVTTVGAGLANVSHDCGAENGMRRHAVNSVEGLSIVFDFFGAANLFSSPVVHVERAVFNLVASGDGSGSFECAGSEGKR
jgi:hypothetical protein